MIPARRVAERINNACKAVITEAITESVLRSHGLFHPPSELSFGTLILNLFFPGMLLTYNLQGINPPGQHHLLVPVKIQVYHPLDTRRLGGGIETVPGTVE